MEIQKFWLLRDLGENIAIKKSQLAKETILAISSTIRWRRKILYRNHLANWFYSKTDKRIAIS